MDRPFYKICKASPAELQLAKASAVSGKRGSQPTCGTCSWRSSGRGGRAAPCSAAGDEGTARGLLGTALLPLAAPAAARLTICKPNGIPNAASGYLDLEKKKKKCFSGACEKFAR